MVKLRKLQKRYLTTVIILFLIYFLCNFYVFSEPKSHMDNKLKLQLVEENINSSINRAICQIPYLPINSTEMLSFLVNEKPIKCDDSNIDWIECFGSVCNLKENIIQKHGNIKCVYHDIIRIDDFNYNYDKSIIVSDSKEYILKQSDFAFAACRSDKTGEKWSGTIIGVRDIPNINNNTNKQKTLDKKINNENINVLMYGFDSLSKNAFIRKLPKSYDYIINKLRGDILNGYNIVGDGTPQALIPLLTGFTELELPETRKRFKNANYVNVYPMIWNEYKKAGYATSFNEDKPNIGTFSYRLTGFKEQPTDHYMRTFYTEIESNPKSSLPLCYQDKPRHQIMLDYTKNFVIKYKNVKNFIFSFHAELSHDSINLIGVADNDLHKWLNDLYLNNVYNNTIVIIMSDHGNRFAEVRNTLQGKLEERLPFFSFIFPEWFKLKYKEIYKNFLINKNRLTTPFDVHATLEDILRLKNFNKIRKTKSRAISLFDHIPKNRSCSDAYIEPHWCSCLNWIEINITDNKNDLIKNKVATSVINLINNYTNFNRKECSMLTLHKIDWLGKLLPNDNLINFKNALDKDGFLGSFFKNNLIVKNELYQIKLTLIPGLSIFEASLTYNTITDNFIVKLSDVSRINKYGDQARCIYDTYPELRKYCYCYDG